MSESIEKIPISITALSADDLTAAGAKSIADLNTLVPGLQFAVPNGFSSAFTTIAIRGLNSNTGPSTVGIYLDEFTHLEPAVRVYQPGQCLSVSFRSEPDRSRARSARARFFGGAGAEAGTVRCHRQCADSLTETTGMRLHGELAGTEGGNLRAMKSGAAAGGTDH